jgi:nucleotide-binding universal stress UspA family protein
MNSVSINLVISPENWFHLLITQSMYKLKAQMSSKILVRFDGSENAMKAARAAVDLTKHYESELIVPNSHAKCSFTPSGLPPLDLTKYRIFARKEAEQLLKRDKIT